jgi:hypothetical protein
VLALGLGVSRSAPVRAAAAPAAPAPPPAAAELAAAARPFLLDAATLAGDRSQFPSDGVVQLYHLRYEQVLPDGLSALVVQKIFQLRDAQAAALFVPDNVWYDSARGRFQLLQATVLRRQPDGAWRTAGEGTDGGDMPNFGANRPRQIQLPGLRAGDRVALVYTVIPEPRPDWSLLGGRFLGNMFALRDSFPTLRARYVLAAGAPITASAVGLQPPQTGVDGAGLATRSWEADHQPAFFSSDNGPAITDVSPFVQVGGFDTWSAMAGWYGGLLASRSRFSPELTARLASIAQPGAAISSPHQAREVVARVWAYLSHHLSYLGNERGLHAYVPAPAGQIFQAGQGDCKDGALLLAAWLRAVGVEANVALVRTPAMGRLAPERDGHVAATMAAFDHALVYVPLTGQWIDTTAPHRLDSELPQADQNSLALIVRAGQSALVRVPAATAAANLTRRELQLRPAAGGWLDASGTIAVQGAAAPALRAAYARPAQRQAKLQAWLQSLFPGAQVDAVEASGISPPAASVSLRFRARIPASPLTVSWAQQHFARELAQESSRSQWLDIPTRFQSDDTWSLQLGAAGCAQQTLPRPVHRSGPFGGVEVSATCQNGWLQVHSSVQQLAERVQPAQYARFRAFWQAVDATLNAPVPTLLPAAAQVAAR